MFFWNVILWRINLNFPILLNYQVFSVSRSDPSCDIIHWRLKPLVLESTSLVAVIWSACSLASSVIYAEFFLGKLVHTSNPQSCCHGCCWAEKFLKFMLPDTLKMHSLALPVVRFPWKTSSNLLKLTLRKTIFRGWFLRNPYIQICMAISLRVAKQFELKRCGK